MQIKIKTKVLRFFIFSILFLSVFSLSFISCSTVKIEKSVVLTGRVTDFDGKAVSGYRICLGKGNEAISGVNGIFSIQTDEYGKYKLTGCKYGYTDINETIEFFDKRSVLIVQVDKSESVYDKIDLMLSNCDFEAAENLISTIDDGNSSDNLFRFYSNLIPYCMEKHSGSENAEKYREKMSEIISQSKEKELGKK